ncbi:MAG: (S)-ureidoglycine aminohydrolase [Bryobacteraceae bacterium]
MPLKHLGFTRSACHRDHAVLTPDTFVRAPLPGMKQATAILHASARMGAAFSEYTAELEAGGVLGPTAAQRFLFVLSGSVILEFGGEAHSLRADGYAFLPEGCAHAVTASEPSRVEVIEKPYVRLAGVSDPWPLAGDERAVAGRPLGGDDGLNVRTLLPADPAFDMAVNTMIYAPGATLPMVEIHVMEHGCLMLEGEGLFRLADQWYPVTAGDFTWMGPYCPQWFAGLGKARARYLIYKDWNRAG